MHQTNAIPAPIPFVDLQAQRRRIAGRIDRAVARVLEHGGFIMGAEVGLLEEQLCAVAGARHCVACASGTDALALALMAWGVRPGDAVFVPAFTFVATAEVVAWLGATPVFVDTEADTFTMSVDSLVEAIAAARAQGLAPKVVMPVDLFGQPADYDRIAPVAAAHGLWLLCDAAQSFGARWQGRPVGSLGDATATSFFPAKPLGCYGDGGAVFTDDDRLAALMRSIRVHGQGADKYDNVRIGINGRLDTLQAAILLEKLSIFPDELEARQRLAESYARGLGDAARVPRLRPGATSSWAQYTLVLDDPALDAPALDAPEDTLVPDAPVLARDTVAARLKEQGIPTAVYYPIPLAEQTGYRHFPVAPGGIPVSRWLSRRVLSLPMHPYLDEATRHRIIAAVRAATTQRSPTAAT